MAAQTTESVEERATRERDSKLRKAYTMASQDLRTKYHDEFLDLQAERCKELGVEWAPRLTAEAKAEREFNALLREFPHLADRFKPDPVPEPGPDPDEA